MFSYRIEYFNGEENDVLKEKGLVSAENYIDATSKLMECYGIVISITLERESDIVPTNEMHEIFLR